MTDEELMDRALMLAREAAREGEVPVGCVIAKDGEIVSEGRNRRETAKNALAHAELEAIGKACQTLGGWRLWQCALYVTLEPCPMCAGAILNAQIPRVVCGAKNDRDGAAGTLIDLFSLPRHQKPEVVFGVREDECRTVLTEFFRKLR
jgi:tRNA(adenine34) deaminase